MQVVSQDQTPSLADRLPEARKRAESLGRYADIWKHRQRPSVEGVVIGVREITDSKEYGSDEYKDPFRAVEVECADGERVAVFNDKAGLRRLDDAEKPEPGDRVLYVYDGDDNERGECQFVLVVERGGTRDVAGDEATETALQAERDARDEIPL